jgi:hypothetical protein
MLFLFRYFDEEDEAASSNLEYIPAPGSPSYDDTKKAKQESSDSEEDPLDAYMANIEKQVWHCSELFVHNTVLCLNQPL